MWYLPELSPFENVQRALLDRNPSLATVLEMGIHLGVPRTITKETLPAYRAEYADVSFIANMSDATFDALDVNTIIEVSGENFGFRHAKKKYLKLPLLYKRQTVTYMVNWLFNSGVWRKPWTPLNPPVKDYVYENYIPVSPAPSPKLNPYELPEQAFMYYADGAHRNGWYYDTVLHRNLKLVLKDNFDPVYLQQQAEEMVKAVLKDFMFQEQLEVVCLSRFERTPVDTTYQVRAKEGSLLYCNVLDLKTPYNPVYNSDYDYTIKITLMEDLSDANVQVGHVETPPVYPDVWYRTPQAGHLPHLPVYDAAVTPDSNVGNTTVTPVYPPIINPDVQAGYTTEPKVYVPVTYPTPNAGNTLEEPVYPAIVYPEHQSGNTTETPSYPAVTNSIPKTGLVTETPSYTDSTPSGINVGNVDEPPVY